MDEKYKKYFKITNLNNTWVITKRHNGNIFFKRKDYVTCLKNQPDVKCLYFDEAEIKEVVSRLNSNRKRCKYGYENASKYFINVWHNFTWNGPIIENRALTIKSVTPNTNIATPQTVLTQVVSNVKYNLSRASDDIKKLEDEMPIELERFKKQLESRIDSRKKDKVTYEEQLSDLNSLNLNEVLKPYETQGDKLVRVLYAKKEVKE